MSPLEEWAVDRDRFIEYRSRPSIFPFLSRDSSLRDRFPLKKKDEEALETLQLRIEIKERIGS